MTNTLEHLGKRLEQQKEDSSNIITQLEACLTETLDEFKHYIRQVIPVYTEKEEIGMLKNEIEKRKEKNNKVKHDMCEKEILIKRLTQTLNGEKANVANTNPTNTQTSISTKYAIRNEKKFCSTSKHSR